MIKRSINNFLLPFAMCFLLAMALYPDSELNPRLYSIQGEQLDYNMAENLNAVNSVTNPDFSPHLGKSFEGFKEALGFKESRGDYFAVNTLGYLGKYQFGASTLQLLGVYNTQEFLKNPKLQEKAFIANLSRNKWVLRKDIKRYVGTTIGSVKVTESGILAAAHLAGPGTVKKFLRSGGNYNFSDAYGATVTYYMEKFAGYNTALIVPNRFAKVELN